MTLPILVIDLGTSSCRLSVIDVTGRTVAERRLDTQPQRGESGSGHVEWDGNALAHTILSAAQEITGLVPVGEVAITNQRTTCLLWEAESSTALGPVLGWADGRTLDLDRQLRREDSSHSPGLSATKWRWLLDAADPDRVRSNGGELRAGTLDSWLVWVLSAGQVHRTDATNAAHTGMLNLLTVQWDAATAERVGVPLSILPEIVEATGDHGRAVALAGAPMIRVIIGDQQASLVGQDCVAPGAGSITLGTVGAIDLVVGSTVPQVARRAGYPTVALHDGGTTSYAVESSIQAAGSAIAWLLRLGILTAPEQIDVLVDAKRQPGSCVFVSALEGLGAPHWKFDARGILVGLSGSDGRAEIVRAVLDGISCALAEALNLLEVESETTITTLSVDGGLAKSDAMMSILAATTGRTLQRHADVEATTRGAALLALRDRRKVPPAELATDVFEPQHGHSADRAAWARAVEYVLDERKNRLGVPAPAHRPRGEGEAHEELQ